MSLYKNILWTVLSRYGSQVLSVFSNVLLARYLGSAGFGEYAFITAIVLVGNAFSTFGMDMVLIRRISSTQDYSDLSSALAIQIMISFVFISGVFILSPFLPAGNSLRLYIFSLIPLSFFTIFTVALRGAQLMGSFSLLNFSVALFQMAAALILLGLKAGIEQLIVLLLCVQFLGALIGFILCITQLKGFPRQWTLNWARILLLLNSSMRMAVIGTLRLVYEKLAVTMLPALAGAGITGLFSASARVLDASKLGHVSALSAIYPEMARGSSLEPDFGSAIKGNYLLLFFAAILLSLGLFHFAKPIIHLLFGEEFATSVEALQVMAWTVIPYFIVTYYSLAFVAIQIEKPVLTTLVSSCFLLAVLLIWWSQLYGLRGAAFAILCAEIFQATLLMLQWRQYAFSK